MLPNVLASDITKSQRWDKLYRIIHHLFLRNEFVHIEDYKKMVLDMNTRIATVEANAQAALSSAITAIVAMNAAHTHPVVTAGGPTNQAGSTTGVIQTPPQLPATPKAPEVVISDAGMVRADAALMAAGPALAPLAGGFSSDQVAANRTIIADVGI